LKTTIGDVKTRVDNKVILSNDENKAAAYCNYFSSVFITDDGTTNNVNDQENKILNETDLETSLPDVEFNDFSIFKALDKLNIYKSPCPDGLMRATKLVLTVKRLTYKERLLQLNLPTLKYRRLRGCD